MLVRRFLAFALVAVPLLSCANATPSVAIINILEPDQMCTVGVSNPPIYDGTFDVGPGATTSYLVFPLLDNRMVTRMRAPGPLTIESDDFTLVGANITIADVDNNVVGNAFRVDANGFAPAGTDTIPGRGVGGITIVPVTLQPVLAGMVMPGQFVELHARIQAFGQTSGGSEIDLDPVIFPFKVCNGCLACSATPQAVPCRPGVDHESYIPPVVGCP